MLLFSACSLHRYRYIDLSPPPQSSRFWSHLDLSIVIFFLIFIVVMIFSLSNDLRTAIVVHFERKNTMKFIQKITEISRRQLFKMKKNWTYCDDVAFSSLTICHRLKVLSQYHEQKLLIYVNQRPIVYLDEIRWFMLNEFNIEIDDSIISRTLKRLRWSKKKIRRVVRQRSQFLRNEWMHRLDQWTAEQLIFFDESAACERICKLKSDLK